MTTPSYTFFPPFRRRRRTRHEEPHVGPVSLRSIRLTGEIVGQYADLVCTQRYRNESSLGLEAIYVFGLPDGAVVHRFDAQDRMRRVEGRAIARENAVRAHIDNLRGHHRTAWLGDAEADAFVARVGSIGPNEEVKVEVGFAVPLIVEGERALLRLPARLTSTQTLAAVASTSLDQSSGMAGPHDAEDRTRTRIVACDCTLEVDLLVRVPPNARPRSSSHEITVTRESTAWRVRSNPVKFDRDFILEIALECTEQRPSVVAHRPEGSNDGWVAFTWVPDLSRLRAARPASGTVFTFMLDRSGSVPDATFDRARQVVRLLLRQLREGDSFQILAFSDFVTPFAAEAVRFDAKSLREADRWLLATSAWGGSRIAESLGDIGDHGGTVVLVTDGNVEDHPSLRDFIVARARKCGTRIYTVGLGDRVNVALLRELARRTGATTTLLGPNDDLEEAMNALFMHATAPRIVEATVEVRGLDAEDVTPSPLPDLVDGEPWTVLARYRCAGPATMMVRGSLDGTPFEQTFEIDLPERAHCPALRPLWVRSRLRDLEIRLRTAPPSQRTAILDTILPFAIRHGVTSQHTAFLLTERRWSESSTWKGERTEIIVSYGLPEGRVIVDEPHDEQPRWRRWKSRMQQLSLWLLLGLWWWRWRRPWFPLALTAPALGSHEPWRSDDEAVGRRTSPANGAARDCSVPRA
ncbi:MAG: VIT and VWA domain-containing protein [Myxococcota bacterium]|nr:VIT and VWA domain-containing protein [Myxococcota bacterium]MDW8361805.1 VIT domain-containing protein [Myxococcales bacterium]